MWLLLFFGGLLLPMATGIMLGVLEPDVKAKGNSVANLCYNLFGWMPAPVVYGWINQYCGGSKSRYGMFWLMTSSIVALLMLILSFVFKKRDT